MPSEIYLVLGGEKKVKTATSTTGKQTKASPTNTFLTVDGLSTGTAVEDLHSYPAED